MVEGTAGNTGLFVNCLISVYFLFYFDRTGASKRNYNKSVPLLQATYLYLSLSCSSYTLLSDVFFLILSSHNAVHITSHSLRK